MQDPDLEILGSSRSSGGAQGARVLTLRVPGAAPVTFRAKWRAHSTTSLRNSPRRELGAYALQKLLVEPGEYVVPPAAPHCFPLEAYRKMVDRRAKATWPNTGCVYGILSYWLEDVQELGRAREEGWFDGKDGHALDLRLYQENAGYRRSIETLNLITYLIAHADSHPKNFLITRDRRVPRIYSIDNSRSLGMARDRSIESRHDWSRMQVPELGEEALERLRQLDQSLDGLQVIAELAPDGDSLVPVLPSGAGTLSTGTDWVDGNLRVGLTSSEIAGIRKRIRALLD